MASSLGGGGLVRLPDALKEYRYNIRIGHSMKIAVDARPLLPPIKGIGRYTLELIRYLVQSDHHWHLYSDRPLAYPFADRPNVSVHVLPLSKYLPAGSTVMSQAIYPLWAKRHGVDVFWSPRHHLPLFLSSRVSSVLTVHDLAWKTVPESMTFAGRLLERMLMPPSIRKASVVTSVSHSTARAVEGGFSLKQEQVSVIPPATKSPQVDVDLCILEEITAGRPYFLFVGTPEPRKNLVRLLKAYALLAPEVRVRAMLVIAGGAGWGGEDHLGLVKRLGLDHDVVFTGYVGEKALAALYSNTLFLAMPSLYEGFGIPLVEAMAYGKPVLTSGNSSMPEVSGAAGLLVDPYDLNSISDGLSEMIDNVERRELLARSAREQIMRFDWADSADQLIELFQSVAHRKSGQGEGLVTRMPT